MIWSRYNFVFRSEKFGGLLYNALTNAFLSVPETVYPQIANLREGEAFASGDVALLVQLTAAGALVEPGEDDRMRDVLRMQKRTFFYSDQYLRLAIAPTLACNCACPYCFERTHPQAHMDEATESALVRFAAGFQHALFFDVSWYGGEPLLRFGQIRRLSEKFRNLAFRKYRASLVTNGTLLTDEVISRLDELAVRTVQVTIDGPQEVHDARRRLLGGGGTYETILRNLDALMASAWDGMLKIRVNVDRDNRHCYAQTYHALRDRYGKCDPHVMIYSGITTFGGKCGLTPSEVADLALDGFAQGGAVTRFYYPKFGRVGCMATCKNAFAVGPDGDLYKCLECIGQKEQCIGSVHADRPWNNPLLARYMEGESALNDPRCIACRYFPICNGNCARERMNGGDACTFFRDRLPQLLEAHYAAVLEKAGAS